MQRPDDSATSHHRVPSHVVIVIAVAIAVVIAARIARLRRASASPVPAALIDRPMSVSWPAVNEWNDRMESEYAVFVARLGQAVMQRRCRRLDECLRDPSANSTFQPGIDDTLRFSIDCADLPYVLRAYFAFKRRLPFGFVAAVRGDAGRDPRYTLNIRPDGSRNWTQFQSPHALLRDIGSMVHSGMYRMAPNVEDSDFYQAAINRRAVRPGTIFYDPNGHVLVVSEVRRDGQVFMIDGHPDGSLTFKRFGEAFVLGTARLGGGFKNFRPMRWHSGRLVRARNAELPLFDGVAQYDHDRYVIDGSPSTYHAWVRAQLAEAGAHTDPIVDFREQVRGLCRDVADRAEAVTFALDAGVQLRPHPDALPDNIYGTDGDWEIYSTPSRDARLKAAFRELANTVRELPDREARSVALRAAWREEVASPDCRYSYLNSRGETVPIGLETVLDRLFDLSFDPYHCPELRWGAPEGSSERSSCPDDEVKLRWYRDELRLRNRIDREYGVPTPLTSGPEGQPDVDVRPLIQGPLCGG